MIYTYRPEARNFPGPRHLQACRKHLVQVAKKPKAGDIGCDAHVKKVMVYFDKKSTKRWIKRGGVGIFGDGLFAEFRPFLRGNDKISVGKKSSERAAGSSSEQAMLTSSPYLWIQKNCTTISPSSCLMPPSNFEFQHAPSPDTHGDNFLSKVCPCKNVLSLHYLAHPGAEIHFF